MVGRYRIFLSKSMFTPVERARIYKNFLMVALPDVHTSYPAMANDPVLPIAEGSEHRAAKIASDYHGEDYN
jgi:hypothetical protein